MTLTSAVHLPHVCCSTNGFIVQDLWCWNKSTRPELAIIHETQRAWIQVRAGYPWAGSMTHPHTPASPGSPWLLWYCPCVGTSQSPQYECLPKVWHWSAGCSGAGEDRLLHMTLNSSDIFHHSWTQATKVFTLRSRCTTLFRCRKATPVRICLANRITSFSVKASSLSATHWLKISPPAALSTHKG